ncbi:MAG: DUF3347 domain-containing protein [Lewinellaceae bacterium]|nr:DUF3347 domain-containing protein [Lewinellaceae bacterium]
MQYFKILLFLSAFSIAAIVTSSCNNNNEPGNASDSEQMDHQDMGHSSVEHSEGMNPEAMQTSVKHSDSGSAILDAYLAIKNALVKDNQEQAAKAASGLFTAVGNFDPAKIQEADQKELKEIMEVVKEHAEHISESEIGHQREHFESLGKDIKDLVAIIGTDRTLYQQYCPMYNDNKGGMWLSASKEVENPLFGSSMPKCGVVKETIAAQ